MDILTLFDGYYLLALMSIAQVFIYYNTPYHN
jgi:hypothetical protein